MLRPDHVSITATLGKLAAGAAFRRGPHKKFCKHQFRPRKINGVRVIDFPAFLYSSTPIYRSGALLSWVRGPSTLISCLVNQ